MDEESLRNRLINRLKGQQQSIEDADVQMESSPQTEKPQKRRVSKAIDSEISSGDMADSCEDDNSVKKKGNQKQRVEKSKKKPKGDKDKEVVNKKKTISEGSPPIKLHVTEPPNPSTCDRSTPKPDTNRASSAKREEKINGRDMNKKKEKDRKQIRKGNSKSGNKSRSRSPHLRSRNKRDTSHGRHRDRSDDSHSKRRDKSDDSLQRRRRARDSRYRSRSRDRRQLSRPRGRYYRDSRRSPRRSASRDRKYTSSSRGRRDYSRPRSRSINRYSYSRSDSTTSFSISSYGSDMDTGVKEKNVMPATSTTSVSGDKGMPAGFGQGLYLPQTHQPDKSKSGIGDLLSVIRQGQNLQNKSTAIAQYTAIFQQISARECEQKEGTAAEPTEAQPEGNLANSKFKYVEQEFPVSHGSEHRKATVDSEIGIPREQGEETQPFTDPASINKMLLGIKPGKYIGDKVTLLPLNLLEGGDPAWVKKNQFKGLAPVRDGIGRKLMERMGWREGMPLGKSGYGAVIPLELDVKTDRKGLGVGSNYLPQTNINMPYSFGQISSIPASAESTDPWSRVIEPNALAGGKHPVCVLMEICAKKHWHNPMFDEIGEQGPKSFKFKVITPMGCFQPQHSSVNKKEAKRQAALACLQALGQLPANTVQFVSSSAVSAPPTNLQPPPPLAPQFPISVPRPMPLPPLSLPPLHLPTPPPPFMLPSIPRPAAVGQTPFYQLPYSF